MTMLKPLLLSILILFTTLVATQCRTIQPDDANLIQETCKKTPLCDLCLKYLNADPKAPSADVKGLALIMVNVMKDKAKFVIKRIPGLIEMDPWQKAALNACAVEYKIIVEGDVPKAIEALKKGNPKLAVDAALDAALQALHCEWAFNEDKAPLDIDNLVMSQVSHIAAAIARSLL